MNIVKYHLADANATKTFGENLGKRLDKATCFLLIGDLGAGKTTLAQAIAKGLEVTETITSPTFSILNTYTSGRLDLHHFDLYRLETVEELEQIGFYEYVRSGVSLVEWADKYIEEMPRRYIVCNLEKDEEGTGRILTLSSEKYSLEKLQALGGN